MISVSVSSSIFRPGTLARSQVRIAAIARCTNPMLRGRLRHFRQHFLGGCQAVQVLHAAQAVFLDLGVHLGPAHRGDLLQDGFQGTAEHSAQPVVPEYLVRIHPGHISR